MKRESAMWLSVMVLALLDVNAAATDVLVHNPFEQPDVSSGQLTSNADKAADGSMELRGTVIDGHDSLVNIDGKYYRLQQEVSGYRVIRIEGGSVTLRRGDIETVLTLHNDK